MKRLVKGIVSFMMMLTIAFTSYAFDFDTIFNVHVEAATYTEKAHSMFEFYKNGASLDRTAISDDELYVFGVFVSNFLMPFQSNVGAMSSDAFVTKMCAMFFGDAYTAQQLADMKYTLGLVQTAQSTRSRLRDVVTGAPVSCDTLYKNFFGFYSETLQTSDDAPDWMKTGEFVECSYTYDGAVNNARVWASGNTAFDAVLGQLISICPSQAGTYLGTQGNATSPLYVDCFGNISDTHGIVIVPACMNPYSFFNKYLDGDRKPISSAGAACPLQLPINNAFWMGTMIDPQELTVMRTDDKTNISSLKYGLMALPNAYTAADNWTTSTTALVGVNTMEGDELGIYFSTEICLQYFEAWRLASGYTGSDKEFTEIFTKWTEDGPEVLNQYVGLYPVQNYMGGTSIGMSSVLDDIVLFDTYNTFSDSLADSIKVLSMFKDENGLWWGLDPTRGTEVLSLFRLMAKDVTSACEQEFGGNWASICSAGQRLLLSGTFDTYIDAHIAEESIVSQMINTILTESKSVSISSEKETIEYLIGGTSTSLSSDTGDCSQFEGIYTAWCNTSSYKAAAWSDNATDTTKRALLRRLMLYAMTGEPTFVFDGGNNGNGGARMQWLLGFVCAPGIEDTNTGMKNGSWWAWDNEKDGDAVIGRPMTQPEELTTTGWFGSATWFNHYFLQKAHPSGALLGKEQSWLASAVQVICASVAIVACIVAIVATGGAAAIALAVAVVFGVAAIGLAISVSLGGSNIATSVKSSGGASAVGGTLCTYLNNLAIVDMPSEYVKYIDKLKSAKGTIGALGSQAALSCALKNATLAEINSIAKGESVSVGGETVSSPLSTYFKAYGHASPGDVYSADGDVSACGANYVFNYAFYGPHRGLASSLAAVSKVYTSEGIVNGNKISTKVGSYITNDVNMWGGIYYAYMVDILGLHFEGDTMKAAQLETNFPDVSTSMTNKNTLNLQGLLDAGTEEDNEAAEAEKRRTLMDRLDELTNLTSSEYRNKLMTQTTNSWLVSTHASLCGASESGSTQNIGSGSRYTGYSGYVTTSTLSEMPFTSWVMEYYNIIYAVLLTIIVVLAICMLITGHRSFRMCLVSVLCMAVTLLIPRLSIDTAVAATNNLASDLYKDRFNFWAYSQHLMYLQDLQNTSSEYEFLIVTNMQQAKDYYDSENGVTLKWMSPKKSSYWDALVGTVEIEGADTGYSGLNLSIFSWLFQGQFRQETYSTDPTATYLYRPYLDIVMTASSFTPVEGSDSWLNQTLDKESIVARESYAAHTFAAWSNSGSNIRTDWDIKPAHRRITGTGAAEVAYLDSYATYASGLWSTEVSNIAYKNFVDRSDVKVYADAYPNSSDPSETSGLEGVNTYESSTSDNVKQFYLYTESPYYYFYYMFKDAAKRYTGSDEGGASELLLSKDFFKYRSSAKDLVAEGENPKHSVDDDTLMDFLDLEGLFTYVIPYLQQSNMYADEWMNLNGREVTAATQVTGADGATVDSDSFKKNLKGIWQMYAPWVDAMYDTTYADGRIRAGGKSYKLDDTINPGYYADIRPMVFSPADMQRNFVTDSDLSEVESRIMSVLENTYKDLMYLNNYTSFDDEVLFSAMAMTATFNFNKEFSDTSLFGEDITMYPVGFEVRNFNYDAFLRLSLLNTTGESIFSDADIYTTVIENTSFFTGVLLIINDIIAVYVVPAMKLVVLLALFFLGLLVCMFAFVTPPEGIWKWIGKNYLLPFGVFVAALISHMLIVSLFVGEGVTSIVGQRGITVTTGDPTITILLMLVVNILYAFALFQVLRLQLKAFKISLTGIGTAAFGFVAGAAGFIAGQIKGGLDSLANGGRSIGRGINRNIQRGKTAKAYAKANAKYGGGASSDDTKSGNASKDVGTGSTDESTETNITNRRNQDEYNGPMRTQPGKTGDSDIPYINNTGEIGLDTNNTTKFGVPVDEETRIKHEQEVRAQKQDEFISKRNSEAIKSNEEYDAHTGNKSTAIGSSAEFHRAIAGSALSDETKRQAYAEEKALRGTYMDKQAKLDERTARYTEHSSARLDKAMKEASERMATEAEKQEIRASFARKEELRNTLVERRKQREAEQRVQDTVNLRNKYAEQANAQAALKRSQSTETVKSVKSSDTASRDAMKSMTKKSASSEQPVSNASTSGQSSGNTVEPKMK